MDQIVDIKLESSHGIKNDNFSSMIIKKDSSMSINENSNIENKPVSFVNFE